MWVPPPNRPQTGIPAVPVAEPRLAPYLTLKPLAQGQTGQEVFGRVRPKLAGERYNLHR